MIDIKKSQAAVAAMNQGRKVEFEPGTTFTVAGFQGTGYRTALQERQRQKASKKDPFPTLSREDSLALMADHILLDWSGVQNDGKPFPYSRENALVLLAIPEIADFISAAATDTDAFKAEANAAAEESLKSSPQVAPDLGGEPRVS